MNKNVLLYLLLFSTFLSNAQEIQITPRYGFIVGFYDQMMHLANQHCIGVEASYILKTNAKKEWIQSYRHPKQSIIINYFQTDPNKSIGAPFSLLYNIGNSIYQKSKLSLHWDVGLGIGATRRKFDINQNSQNILISTNLSYAFNLNATLKYKLSSSSAINLSTGVLHHSNGSYSLPNMGLNIAQLGIGYHYHFNNPPSKKDSTLYNNNYTFKRKTNIDIYSGLGLIEIYPINGPKYLIFNQSYLVERRVTRKSGIQTGVDWAYNQGTYATIRNKELEVSPSKMKQFRIAYLIGHELYFNKTSFISQIGVYIYDPLKLNKSFYQKIGLNYQISSRFSINTTLKVHLGAADFVTYGLRYKI